MNIDNNGVQTIKKQELQYYKDVIRKLLQTQKDEITSLNQIQLNEERFSFFDDDSIDRLLNQYKPIQQKIVPYKDHSQRILLLNQRYSYLNETQTKAFDHIITTISSSNSQLIMFLTGEGGTGKSEIIKLSTEFTKLYFGKQEGIYGPALVLAATGTAAKNVEGFTWQSALNSFKTNDQWTNEKAQKVGEKIKGIKLIIDEISLISLEVLYEIHYRIQSALLAITPNTDNEKRRNIESKSFGGIHVLLCGDLYQLQCVGGTPLYFPQHKISKPKAKLGYEIVWSKIASFVELTENMRISNPDMSDEDKRFIKFLSLVRTGNVNNTEFSTFLQYLNQNKLSDFESSARKMAHPDALWIANTKEDANLMNDEQFKLLKDKGYGAIRFIAYHQNSNNANSIMPNDEVSKQLYALNPQRNNTISIVPTYIDLCIGSRVMLTSNVGTEIGLTNGTVGKVVAFGIDNAGTISEFIQPKNFYNTKVPSAVVFVEFPSLPITVKDTIINGKPYSNVIPVSYVGNMKQPIKVNDQKYYRWQLPLIPAAALNTHKVQGITAKNGIVFKPTAPDKFPFARGLEYVALSRCKQYVIII